MASRFVRPESVRLSISGGDFLDVKKRLTHGEREDMHASWAPFVTPGEPLQLNRREVRTAKVFAYLLGWSLTDDDQKKPVPMSPDLPDTVRLATIRSLDPDTFDEIHTAIMAHEEAVEAERAERKNTQDGETVLPATSPSRSGVAGVMTTSELLTQTFERSL